MTGHTDSMENLLDRFDMRLKKDRRLSGMRIWSGAARNIRKRERAQLEVTRDEIQAALMRIDLLGIYDKYPQLEALVVSAKQKAEKIILVVAFGAVLWASIMGDDVRRSASRLQRTGGRRKQEFFECEWEWMDD